MRGFDGKESFTARIRFPRKGGNGLPEECAAAEAVMDEAATPIEHLQAMVSALAATPDFQAIFEHVGQREP